MSREDDGFFDPPPDHGSESVNVDPETTEQAVVRLAELSPIEYDKVRDAEAEALGVRVSTLDSEVKRARKEAGTGKGAGAALVLDPPEPWLESVDGAALADELAGLIRKHLVLSVAEADAVALWVLHSHAHEYSSVSPLLAVTSPQKRCGKTTLMSLLGALVPLPLPASNITAAALFRAVEKWRPTLLIDEADSFLRDSDELRGVINSGHNRAGAFVIRTTGDDHEPKAFSTWAPKAIALIGRMPPTLTDRSIMVALKRKRPDEGAKPLRIDQLDVLEDIPRRCARWVRDSAARLRRADPAIPRGLHDRAADNWRCLLAIADAAGGDWPQRARLAAVELTGDDADEAAAVMLLDDLNALFTAKGDRLGSADAVEHLGKMDTRPWPEWRRGKPITQNQIARLLKPFGIEPTSVRVGTWHGKGYKREHFADTFSRYTPPQSVTPGQVNDDAASSPIRSGTPNRYVPDENPPKPAPRNDCPGVTGQEPINRRVKL